MSIGAILEQHANWAHRWGKDSPDTYIYGTHNFKPMTLETVEAEKAIRKAVAEDMLELVGEDEPEEQYGEQIPAAWLRNKLRAELRQKIKEWSALKETTNE